MIDGNGATYDAARELSTVVGKAEELLQALSGEAGQAVNELRARVEGTISAARKRLTELNGTARDAANRAAEITDKYVTTNPWTAVAFATAAGAIAGALLARRR